LAKDLDPNDPTPWLYSALHEQQQRHINEAIRDFEESQARNDQRRLFRSRLLLDQDRAVRGANLASAYRDAGWFEVAQREAAKAVHFDYANAAAHRFLANSYEALRDPRRVNLRYETPAVNEWLMANLLAPVGAGSLARNVSQQDYGRLFEGDRLGFSSQTEYNSQGDWVTTASQYGTFGGTSYSLDAQYRSELGYRPNHDLDHRDFAAQIKQRLGPDTHAYLLAEYLRRVSGDLAQYYDSAWASPSLRLEETQEPNLFLGLHREWGPGSRTLLLAGRLQDERTLQAEAGRIPFFYRNLADGASTFVRIPDRGSSALQGLQFEEKGLRFTAHQLLGRAWSLGVGYRLSAADLETGFAEVTAAIPGSDQLNQNETAVLHQLTLSAHYNHPSGFFAEVQSQWHSQSNRGYSPDRPGDDFWQVHCFAGYRFAQRKAEVRLGLLNVTDQDYRLNPLNLYAELPHDRALVLALKLNF